MARKLTIEEVRQYVHENSDCELLSTEYVNAREKLEFRCGCGEVFQAAFNKFKSCNKRQCNGCGKLSVKLATFYNTVEKVTYKLSLFGASIAESPNYFTVKDKLIISCKCGDSFETTCDKVLNSSKVLCNTCSRDVVTKKQTKSEGKYLVEFNQSSGGEYKLLSHYDGAYRKVEICHLSCGKSYFTNARNFLRGSRCPYCRQSKGEAIILNELNDFNLNYKVEYHLTDCRSYLTLPFDFAVFSDKSQEKPEFLIEYDGIQHFEPVDFFGGQEQFEKQQLHDRIKDDYCKQNGIELIRIPYWEQDNIEEILAERLCSLIEGSLPEKQHCLSL